jgi:prevent-host-death family protein
MVMNYVSTAELKAKLSHYLGKVKEGEAIYVTSHQKPVAELIPVLDASRIKIVPPTLPVSVLSEIEGVNLQIDLGGVDVDRALREDRDSR